MTEGRTTAIFAIVAAITLGLAWWSKPESAVSEQDAMEDMVGKVVFSSFADPETAASMQIVKYDEELAQLRRFEVARDPNTKLWTLPSHDGYPADAAEQVKDATTPFIDLNVLSVASDLKSDHELYGVVNPDDEELAAGTSGVGMLVTFKDESDQVLASMVIGKEVEQAEGQRYVRIPTEDVIYVVELSTDAFTTDFRDWIEGELLGVRSMDIRKVGVRDYTIERSLTQVTLQRNYNATVVYNPTENDWQLEDMTSYASGSPVPTELAEGEELNAEFLNALRTAVQDLEIIDVQRKPQGLAADLKADDSLLKNEESIQDLQQQGFYAAQGTDGTEIFAAGGETIVGTENGVDYLLRFGEATASLSSMDGDENDDGGLSRYLLVTAKLDESKFPAPDLEPLPETVEDMLARERGDQPEDQVPPAQEIGSEEDDDAEKSEDAPAESADVTDTDATATEATDTDGEASDDQTDGAETSSAESASEESEAQETAEPSPGEADDRDELQTEPVADKDAPAADATAESEDSAVKESANEAVDEEEKAEEQAAPQSGETTEELQERLEALREDIAKENQRKIDERNDKIDAARKKVLELNARFSDWYYVVADSAYEKLKVSREDLIKKADSGQEAPAFSTGVPGLEGLQLPPQP